MTESRMPPWYWNCGWCGRREDLSGPQCFIDKKNYGHSRSLPMNFFPIASPDISAYVVVSLANYIDTGMPVISYNDANICRRISPKVFFYWSLGLPAEDRKINRPLAA